MLYRLDISPDKTEFPQWHNEQNYYIDVEFNNSSDNDGFLSGISSGDAYPIMCKNAITSATSVLGSTADSSLISIGSMGSFTAS